MPDLHDGLRKETAPGRIRTEHRVFERGGVAPLVCYRSGDLIVR